MREYVIQRRDLRTRFLHLGPFIWPFSSLVDVVTLPVPAKDNLRYATNDEAHKERIVGFDVLRWDGRTTNFVGIIFRGRRCHDLLIVDVGIARVLKSSTLFTFDEQITRAYCSK